MTTDPRPSVILVREWEQQMSSSGCCGRLEGDVLLWRGERCFPERRAHMESAGGLYRAIQERFGDTVQVHVVDPRNLPGLLPMLLRDFWRHRVPARTALRTLSAMTVTTVVVNGRLFSSGGWPPAGLLCDALSDGKRP